ncbi:NADH-quinone oxidoreductase subunit NuoK [Pectinatus cerevisiiphilus]|uniref:NADH-quinone oxidoreductase subunit K n=1 Tax=Pectinatus cerevisiiphilus TaxID=86956 RepID=A0A4R3K949_9FIRM|nr:NADH-quinone oxidoreductase subunit NuoK [Pectinatus cerevisiiphilus]TCS79373.1 NADH-quinone oxidoreductase subunit K/NAD(P)H-quinone oxidoreductase subunit 4L [Pectinatus cerevisiiphilus]
MTIGITHFLIISAALFCIGLYGILIKRNLFSILMCIELMLNAVNINLVAFNHFLPTPNLSGQLMVLFSITVAAAEVAVGLALIFRVYRDFQTVNIDKLNSMKG